MDVLTATMNETQFVVMMYKYIPNFLKYIIYHEGEDYNAEVFVSDCKYLAILCDLCYLPSQFCLHSTDDEMFYDLSLAVIANHKRINYLYETED